jgi:predicted aldo/keto reductase-like oxidoreductase
LGLGGFHVGVQAEVQDSLRIVRYAIDQGVDFLDNCWDYNGGQSEVRMGLALRDGYRERVFLTSKIDGRDRRTAARQIDESLARLQTDHVDLMQFHEVMSADDAERIFAPSGGMEAMVAARQAGKVRFIGFTGHRSPAAHLTMLATAARQGFVFDAVQMPVNVMDAQFDSFLHQVVPVLQPSDTAVLAMKTLGEGFILRSGLVSAAECLRFVLDLPVHVAIVGCETLELLDQALATARGFQPLAPAEREELLQRTAAAARDGVYEPYKTTDDFDATRRNLHWLYGDEAPAADPA